MPESMGEWWTYGLADFLMFAPRTYYRMLELYNREIWPAQLAALALGLAIPALLRWGGRWRGWAVAAILAAGWTWTAWMFHWRHYATINWPASWFATGFAVQALLLIGVGGLAGRLRDSPQRRPARIAAYGLLFFALLIEPLIGLMLGRPLGQIELFGVAPDPTTVATLGVVLLIAGRARWLLLPIPLLWCAMTGLTLWTMAAPDFFVVPLAGLLAILVASRPSAAGPPHDPGFGRNRADGSGEIRNPCSPDHRPG